MKILSDKEREGLSRSYKWYPVPTACNTAYLVTPPLVASPKLLTSVATSDMLGTLVDIFQNEI